MSITTGMILGALVGIILGIGVERLLRRIELLPLFRVKLGYFDSIEGQGFYIDVENIGLFPLPRYVLSLHHPKRGSFAMFPMEKNSEFPQYPTQTNKFRCVTRSRTESEKQKIMAFFDYYFLRENDEEISLPEFKNFVFRITLDRSDNIFFKSEDIGNTLAKWIYQDYTGSTVQQDVKEVTYKSKAPFYMEYFYQRRKNKYLSELIDSK
jgi:hypothetical protein